MGGSDFSPEIVDPTCCGLGWRPGTRKENYLLCYQCPGNVEEEGTRLNCRGDKSQTENNRSGVDWTSLRVMGEKQGMGANGGKDWNWLGKESGTGDKEWRTEGSRRLRREVWGGEIRNG